MNCVIIKTTGNDIRNLGIEDRSHPVLRIQ